MNLFQRNWLLHHEDRLVKASLALASGAFVLMLVVLSKASSPVEPVAKGIPVSVSVRPSIPAQTAKEAEVAIEVEAAELAPSPKKAVASERVEQGVQEKKTNIEPTLDSADERVAVPLIEEDAKPSASFSANQEMFLSSGETPENLEFSVLPPTPGDDYVPELSSDELPGGDVLVLGVLVDHTGRVLDARIIVPSRNPINDLSFFIASKDATYTGITPPILPGEPRWIPLELKYDRPGNGLLP